MPSSTPPGLPGKSLPSPPPPDSAPLSPIELPTSTGKLLASTSTSSSLPPPPYSGRSGGNDSDHDDDAAASAATDDDDDECAALIQQQQHANDERADLIREHLAAAIALAHEAAAKDQHQRELAPAAMLLAPFLPQPPRHGGQGQGQGQSQSIALQPLPCRHQCSGECGGLHAAGPCNSNNNNNNTPGETAGAPATHSWFEWGLLFIFGGFFASAAVFMWVMFLRGPSGPPH